MKVTPSINTVITFFPLLSTLILHTLAAHAPARRQHRNVVKEYQRAVASSAKLASAASSLNISTATAEGVSDTKVITGSINTTATASSTSFTAPSTLVSTTTSISSAITTAPTSSANPTATYTPDESLQFAYPQRNFKINSRSYKSLTKALPKILKNANSISIHSWELGCFTETLLEVYNPSLTPFEWENQLCASSKSDDIPWNVIKIAKNSLVAYNWTGSPSDLGSCDGELKDYLDNSTSPVKHIPKALINGDGALGDPVSLVPAIWVLAQFAKNRLVNLGSGMKEGEDYSWAVGNQLDYLFSGPTQSNIISQREDSWELWADMMYMIPPSLTYMGLSLSNEEYLHKGLEQWDLESKTLLNSTVNIYNHVTGWDMRLWATGNGWAVYGAIRNLYAAKAMNYRAAVVTQAEDTLTEVFTGLFNELDDQNLLPNYMKQDNATLAVGDTAGTALTVAAYYRFIKLCPAKANPNLTKLAEKAFDAVVDKIDKDGWVTHAVDPMGTYGWVVYPDDLTIHSPEAQAFAAKMWKARTEAGI
ncbi:uncharacterized protein I206_106067 [Kwoniella pini CBS 10737]|uniref:Uncharacterized protein n=1 Tax=Kwoniella pini CBS 10737 TaxID=1296096 RepID=A0A1B9I0X5_9TREE|nr:uncharacterized protein I206_04890 [Kwoniella pini CBS 10737]OCF49202.1 hypothetical protein I206_04890 [Kwoniella pini CBS 10737]